MNHHDFGGGDPNYTLLLISMVANIAICVAYVAVSVCLTLTRFKLIFLKWRTRIWGAAFFLTCGLHHFMNIESLVYAPHDDLHLMMLHPAMLVIDIIQAVAIWIFAASAAVELRDIAVLRRMKG